MNITQSSRKGEVAYVAALRLCSWQVLVEKPRARARVRRPVARKHSLIEPVIHLVTPVCRGQGRVPRRLVLVQQPLWTKLGSCQ